MSQNYKKLVNNVISNNYCCGCGICSGVCSKKVFTMKFDELGTYKPYIVNREGCINCGLCIKVCPFFNENLNEKAISDKKFLGMEQLNFNNETGYFINSYVGYAQDEIRNKSASGGVLTSLLVHLLDNKLVDRIITVKPTMKKDPLFMFCVASNKEDLLQCSGSVYYPIEMSGVIEYILKNKGTYAIVGLPCFIKGLELLKGVNKKALKRIKFTLGLTCGQLKTKKFTEYLYAMTDLKEENLVKVIYRKIKGPLNSNYSVEFSDRLGNIAELDWDPDIALIWGRELFKMKSCYHCDDVFAECADATFMDAWLPEYSNEYKGVSLVINRNSQFDSFFKKNSNIDTISIDKVIESQDMVLKSKRDFRDIIDRAAFKKLNYFPYKRNIKWTKRKISRSEMKIKLMRYKYSDTVLEPNTENGRVLISSIIVRLNSPPFFVRMMLKIKKIPFTVEKIVRGTVQ